ncbi:MAG: glycoside hydrolase family 6 protein [Aeromicrobium sp.]|uniref:glycoside hydrolase family 6 protein n=1 Tax=Aeromicrobium sp. TaxID=1871063 RepID=UPI0039E616F7
MTTAARRGLAVAVAVMIAGMILLVAFSCVSRDDNPFAGRQPYVWPGSAAAQAASEATGSEAEVLSHLASTPTAVWLTPEAHGTGGVADFVNGIARDADGRLVVYVVYGITDRDCAGGESTGGLPPEDYRAWVEEIAGALAGDPVVVLEPDALATLDECGSADERIDLLSSAVDELGGAASVYLDAGHSDWIDAGVMADRLRRAGVERARGFSLNVANYDSDADELAYAEQIREHLPEAHYIVDSGRNGRGGVDGQWCNVEGRALGVASAAVEDGSALDARWWIKPPGESDGQCRGGPPAGQFSVSLATELAENAGLSQ